MIIIHHNDADGHCAAAIVSLMIAHDMEPIKFIEYNYGKHIELPNEEIHEKERVFIVDLSLDKTLMQIIRRCLRYNCEIIHIDHHIGGKRFEENLQESDKILYERVTNFYKETVSGCLLTYIYAFMTDTERKSPQDIPFDFTEDYSHVAFYPEDKTNMREIFIPQAIRYIDDNDTFRHQFPESKTFALSYLSEDNRPQNKDFWEKMIYSNDYAYISDMIMTGRAVSKYQDYIYRQCNRSGFEYTIDEFKGWIVNCAIGNSFLFGDKYKEYDFVCKYAYDGAIRKWRYSLYANKDSKVDCAELCRKYFDGNGHKGAAGGSLDYNFFEKKSEEA